MSTPPPSPQTPPTAPPYWPLTGLTITTADLDLRPVLESDLPVLAERLPPDLELDPSAQRFATGDEHTTRGATVYQQYWHAVGTWTPQSWHLLFAVRHAGRLVGLQGLRARDFPALRTVDTWSYLHADRRGQGLGRQARRAVLTLAFDGLDAVAATTSAWDDNTASHGVSAALGYVANGVHRQRRDSAPDGVGVMAHARLTRSAWDAGGHASGVQLGGLTPCLPWFGLDPQRLPLR